MSVLLVLIGLAVFCVGVFAGLRGHLGWARLPNRRRAGGAALVGLALFLAGGALAKPVQPVTLTSSPAPVARASTRSPLPKATADQAAAAKAKATADQAAAAKAAADQAAAAKAAADQAAAAKAAADQAAGATAKATADQAAAAKATADQAAAAKATADQAAAAKAAADQAAAAKAAADQAAAATAAADQAAAATAAADQAAAAKAVAPAPAPAAPAAQVFANCTDLHVVYPHGVGRPGAVDHVGGSTRPVTTFFVSEELYNANSFSDRDGDGIACEKR